MAQLDEKVRMIFWLCWACPFFWYGRNRRFTNLKFIGWACTDKRSQRKELQLQIWKIWTLSPNFVVLFFSLNIQFAYSPIIDTLEKLMSHLLIMPKHSSINWGIISRKIFLWTARSHSSLVTHWVVNMSNILGEC